MYEKRLKNLYEKLDICRCLVVKYMQTGLMLVFGRIVSKTGLVGTIILVPIRHSKFSCFPEKKKKKKELNPETRKIENGT